MEIKTKSILEIGNGRILELADHELKKVLTNIIDPNTDYKKVRKITIELKFKPNEDRSQITIGIGAKTNIAPNKPSEVVLFNTPDYDGDGVLRTKLREVTSVAPGQMSFDGKIQTQEVFEIGLGE